MARGGTVILLVSTNDLPDRYRVSKRLQLSQNPPPPTHTHTHPTHTHTQADKVKPIHP